MPATPLTVDELRARWQPHKERLDAGRQSHPTSVRFHRACSWLEAAEQFDGDATLDHALICRWIAFNALYGQWDVNLHEPVGDRYSWQVFLTRILELDRSGHVVELLKVNRRLVLAILGNAYLNRFFWHEPSGESPGPLGRGSRHKGESLYAQGSWGLILEQVVERIYLLRCQLMHGAATRGSRLNRTALKHGQMMMRLLLPAILVVWIENGADEDWGLLCYPPVGAAARP